MGFGKFFAKLLGFEGNEMEKAKKGMEEMEREKALKETTEALEKLPEETTEKYERKVEETPKVKPDENFLVEEEEKTQETREDKDLTA